MAPRCGRTDCPPGVPPHWSHMPCSDVDTAHQNHTWNSEYVIYGPYWCPGLGVQAPPAAPSETQYTNDPVDAYIIDGDLDSLRHRADITDEDVVWERTVSYGQWKRLTTKNREDTRD